jgi:hypothetical protein
MHTALNAVAVPWQHFNKRKGKKDVIQRVKYLHLLIIIVQVNRLNNRTSVKP